jgi:hypothetical protein
MKYIVFLFYYSLIVSTAIFVWSIYKAPKPLGLLFVILILPMGLYFWTRLRGAKSRAAAHGVEGEKVKDRVGMPLLLSMVVILTLLISAFSIFAYVMYQENSGIKEKDQEVLEQIKILQEDNKKLSESLDEVKSSLLEVETSSSGIDQETDDFISEISGPKGTIEPISGYVTIKDNRWKTLDIYQTNIITSATVGQAELGETYEYYKVDNNWYQIELNNGVRGWIDGRFVSETSAPAGP